MLRGEADRAREQSEFRLPAGGPLEGPLTIGRDGQERRGDEDGPGGRPDQHEGERQPVPEATREGQAAGPPTRPRRRDALRTR